MQLFFILGIPLFLAGASLYIKNNRIFGFVNMFGYCFIALSSVTLAYSPVVSKTPLHLFDFFYVDALSGFFIFTISLVNLASAIYSLGYIGEDVREGLITERKAKVYYMLFNLFSFSMFFVMVVNNLGILWVAIELTTLASALLVGFYNTKNSIEAAWKYIIICSVGIALALLGTILFYYALSLSGGINSLNWTDIAAAADRLDPKILKIAFLFILVGYGTKAGVVPMHTWLPDAHSQALTPVSALLSGVLLKTAVYAILRFIIIINKCAGAQYSENLLVFFGLISIGVSAGFILLQKDIKRMLAYSSIEHIGVILTGLGLSGTLGVYGALLHIFNHAVTKSLMFFSAGNIVKKYKTNNMHILRGVSGAMPFTGVFFILGAFALAGSPPFSIFMSEIIILTAGFLKGAFIVTALFLLFIAVIFGAIIYHFSKVVFGRKPEGMAISGQPLSIKAAIIFLFVFMCAVSFKVPFFLDKLLAPVVSIIKGI